MTTVLFAGYSITDCQRLESEDGLVSILVGANDMGWQVDLAWAAD